MHFKCALHYKKQLHPNSTFETVAMKAPFIVLLLVAAAVAAANSPLFQILADDTSDVIFCKADGVKSCRKIRVNYDTVDEDRIHVGEYEYLKKHSIDKGDHMLYGYEVRNSRKKFH